MKYPGQGATILDYEEQNHALREKKRLRNGSVEKKIREL